MVRTDVQPASWWLAGLPRSSSSRPQLAASPPWLLPVVPVGEHWTFVRSSVARQRPPVLVQAWTQPRASEAQVHAPAALADPYEKPA